MWIAAQLTRVKLEAEDYDRFVEGRVDEDESQRPEDFEDEYRKLTSHA